MVRINLSLLFAATLSTFVAQFPTVAIKPGVVNGAKCPTTAVASFSSIPYVQPSVDDLRFAPPQAFPGGYSGGSLNATTRAPSCVQF
jgi:carboxylesterase type B